MLSSPHRHIFKEEFHENSLPNDLWNHRRMKKTEVSGNCCAKHFKSFFEGQILVLVGKLSRYLKDLLEFAQKVEGLFWIQFFGP